MLILLLPRANPVFVVIQIGHVTLTMHVLSRSVIWAEHADNIDGLAPVQTVTRIDAFLQFCKKAPLARCMNAWLAELPEDSAHSPPPK